MLAKPLRPAAPSLRRTSDRYKPSSRMVPCVSTTLAISCWSFRERVKGRVHLGRRGAYYLQERDEGIEATGPTKIEHSDPILLSAKTDQEVRRSRRIISVILPHDMDDALRAKVAVGIRGTGNPPRSVEEAATLCEQATRRVQTILASATALNRPERQGGDHGTSG